MHQLAPLSPIAATTTSVSRPTRPNTTRELNTGCRCSNCIQMPTNIENRCCNQEQLDRTTLSGYTEGSCILNCEEIVHVLSLLNVQISWLRHRRFFGHTGDALLFTNITDNKTYRYHAYRCYIDYIHGLLGKYNRKVIPSCIVNHIRTRWPDPFNSYKGFVQVDEDGNEIAVEDAEAVSIAGPD